MINITDEKRRMLTVYQQRDCPNVLGRMCEKPSCQCELLAEYSALKNLLIPNGYANYTIKDFTGVLGKDGQLEAKTTIRAKKKVINYCYGDVSLEEAQSLTEEELSQRSIIADRLNNGHSVVIHGDSSRVFSESNDDFSKVVKELPLGRTFIASVLSREAAGLSIQKEHHKKSFEWIDFANLAKSLTGKSVDERYESAYYEDCEWLVVDDISASSLMASNAQKAWTEPLYNAFFSYRHKRD